MSEELRNFLIELGALKERAEALKSRAEQAEQKVRSLEKELEEARALVASYDRQDDLIGTEFEGVDEATDVIRLLKDERDLLKQSLESSRAAIDLQNKLGRYIRHTVVCDIHRTFRTKSLPAVCDCGLSELQSKLHTLLSTLTKEEKV